MLEIARAKTWLEISSSAVANNLATLRSVLSEGAVLCAVVKANAYGHGLDGMVRLCSQNEVDIFGVDSIDEAQVVRNLVPRATIFILGTTFKERAVDVVRNSAIQTVASLESLLELVEAAKSVGRKALVSLKLETGLNRQGIDGRELSAIMEAVKAADNWLEIVSIASHLASSEEVEQPEPTMEQLQRFQLMCQSLEEQGLRPRYKHIACSAATLLYPASHGNLVRSGLGLYGLWPSAGVKRQVIFGKRRLELMPALSWKTKLVQVKNVAPGARVGYGGSYVANRPMRLGVLPIGYYDGYDRRLANSGEVIIRGVRCPIVGKICMNMTMVDVSQVPGAKREDAVILLGRDGMHAITADDLAEKLSTINYEVVTRLNPLIPRITV